MGGRHAFATQRLSALPEDVLGVAEDEGRGYQLQNDEEMARGVVEEYESSNFIDRALDSNIPQWRNNACVEPSAEARIFPREACRMSLVATSIV